MKQSTTFQSAHKQDHAADVIRISGARPIIRKKAKPVVQRKWDERFYLGKLEEQSVPRKNKIEFLIGLKESRNKKVANHNISDQIQKSNISGEFLNSPSSNLIDYNPASERKQQIIDVKQAHQDQENIAKNANNEKQSATVSKLRSNVAFGRQSNFTAAFSSVRNAIENREQALKRLISTGNTIDQEQELVEQDFLKYEQLFSDLRITSIIVLQALQTFKKEFPSAKKQKDIIQYAKSYESKMKQDYLEIGKTPLGKYFYIMKNDPLLSKGHHLSGEQLNHLRAIPISEHHQQKIANLQSNHSPSKYQHQINKVSKPPQYKREKYQFSKKLRSFNKRESRSQNALDNRSISSNSRAGSNGKRVPHQTESQRRIIQTYIPKPQGRQFKSNFERNASSRDSKRMLKSNSSESRIKANKAELRQYLNSGGRLGGRGQVADFMTNVRDGASIENSPISTKSQPKRGVENVLKSKKTSLPGKLQSRLPYAPKHISSKVSEAYQPQTNISKMLGKRIEPSKQKSTNNSKNEKNRFVQSQDGYILQPLDVLQTQISLMLKNYYQQLDFGMRSSFVPYEQIFAEIEDHGFESMFLKLTQNKVMKGIVIFTNDSTSYLRRRVKIFHMTILERGERGLQFKRLVQMTLNYIWKFTLADEIKIELLHHRKNQNEDLQADDLIKETLKEHKFRWKSLLNENDRRGEVMGRSRAEVQSQRKNQNPEQEPVLLNIGLSLQQKQGKQGKTSKMDKRSDGLETIQVLAASEFKQMLYENKKEEEQQNKVQETKAMINFSEDIIQKQLQNPTKFVFKASKVKISQNHEEVQNEFEKAKIKLTIPRATKTDNDQIQKTMGVICSISSRWRSYQIASFENQNYIRLKTFNIMSSTQLSNKQFFILETDQDQIKFAILPIQSEDVLKNTPINSYVSKIFASAQQYENKAIKELSKS